MSEVSRLKFDYLDQYNVQLFFSSLQPTLHFRAVDERNILSLIYDRTDLN